MKKFNKVLCLLLVVVACLASVQPVSAKTKYTQAEKNLAFGLACFQGDDLLDPDSFKIKKISKVKYTLDKENYESYAAFGFLYDYKTISWKVDFTAHNAFGGTVRDTVYVTSTGLTCTDDDMEWEDYTDKTNYAKSGKSKSFVKKIKKLTSKYYRELEF